MIFPLSIADISLWLAVTTLILLVTSEFIFALPEYSVRILFDKRLIRMCALGCGIGFLATVVMRIMNLA